MNDLGYGSPEKPIETILVFKDPSDWYMDLQIMLDICVGGQSQDPIQCQATAMRTCLGTHMVSCSTFVHSPCRQELLPRFLPSCWLTCQVMSSITEKLEQSWYCYVRENARELGLGVSAGGVIGEWSPEGNPRRVKVYFSDPDLLWASEHPAPRLGQGGFATALKALFKEVRSAVSAGCTGIHVRLARIA